jgi:hypothetical protein
VLPSGVGEPTVPAWRSDVAAPDGHSQQLPEGFDGRRNGDTGLHGDALTEAGERVGDLFAGQPDERVGAEHGRVVPVEGGRVAQ